MKSDPDVYLTTIGEIARGLRALGLTPVLVGGMALTVLGSTRVTRDVDFVVRRPQDRLEDVLGLFYERGFELVSKVDDGGNVVRTVDNRRVAAIRLRLDGPASAGFYNFETGFRIDLLFDFPLEAATLVRRATRMKVQSHVFEIASAADLLTLKKIAAAARSFPGDTQDIAFLEAHLARQRT
ncbi:MAG TPA: hypothetical protein VFZ36_01140 [Vicinamibacterales bacterium]